MTIIYEINILITTIIETYQKLIELNISNPSVINIYIKQTKEIIRNIEDKYYTRGEHELDIEIKELSNIKEILFNKYIEDKNLYDFFNLQEKIEKILV